MTSPAPAAPRSSDPFPERQFSERQLPPWWVWLVMLVMAVSVGVVSMIAFPPAGVLASIAVAAVVGSLLLVAWAGRVEVVDGELRAGSARIPMAALGSAVALDAQQAAAVRGREINAAAYHYLRGWVPEAVKVEVADPQDPTPYWYVATHRPNELVAALEAARPAPTRP
jgi:hypothetical protein